MEAHDLTADSVNTNERCKSLADVTDNNDAKAFTKNVSVCAVGVCIASVLFCIRFWSKDVRVCAVGLSVASALCGIRVWCERIASARYGEAEIQKEVEQTPEALALQEEQESRGSLPSNKTKQNFLIKVEHNH